jgi:hypothetical protein
MLRNSRTVPLFTITAELPAGALADDVVPFDGVTVHGNTSLQFISRDASKPGVVGVTPSRFPSTESAKYWHRIGSYWAPRAPPIIFGT